MDWLTIDQINYYYLFRFKNQAERDHNLKPCPVNHYIYYVCNTHYIIANLFFN